MILPASEMLGQHHPLHDDIPVLNDDIPVLLGALGLLCHRMAFHMTSCRNR